MTEKDAISNDDKAKKDLERMMKKRPHCGYLDYDTPLWKKYGCVFGGIIVAWVLIVFGTSIPYHFMNKCLSYTGASFYAIGGVYCLSVLLFLVLLFIYARNVKFCSPEQRLNHFCLTFALVSAMGSVLNWYDLYAFNLNLFAAGMAIFMFYIVFLLFVAVFLEGHLRSCPEHRIHSGMLEGRSSCCFDISVGFWFIVWITFVLLVFFYDGDIYTITDPPRPGGLCVKVD